MQYPEPFKPRHVIPTGIFPSDRFWPRDSAVQKSSSSVQVQQDAIAFTHREASRRKILTRISIQDFPGGDLFAEYIRHLFRKNCRLGTIYSSYGVISQFLSYLRYAGLAELASLQRSNIEGFVERQQDRGLNPSSIRTHLGRVYAFIRFLVDNEFAGAELLVRKVAVRLPTPLPKDIHKDDEDLLLSVIDDVRDRAMILLLLRTGMRIGELLSVTMRDINLQMQSIAIGESEKTGSGRVVYFSNDAAKALYDWLMVRDPSHDRLFYGRRGGRLSYAAARKMFCKYISRAGLSHKGYTLHSLRHTLATSLLNVPIAIEVVQAILGHVTLKQTQRYAKLYDKTCEEEYFRAMAIIEGEPE
jgi:site-specific recombinase XerD